ncbi:MAG: GAF and ANTAR domain-containing protein [Mycobacteriaceae bacterium]|nr:GAF and ANTAR domain-containing protein [Mycobacteriaceae bacterium]
MYAMLNQIQDLHRRGAPNFTSALHDINATNVRSIPGAEYAGITILDNVGQIRTLAATHRYATELDDVQRETREGPCLSAAWTHHTICIDDLGSEARWPRYRDAALQRTPVRSILSFRLTAENETLAALNLYAQAPGAFDEESVELGLIFATHTALAWNLMNRERQFRSALSSRDVIGQAKGILMERFSIDAVAAFELLRQLSQESNTKLADVAANLIASEHQPE